MAFTPTPHVMPSSSLLKQGFILMHIFCFATPCLQPPILTDRSTLSERSLKVGCFTHRSWYT